MGILVMNIQSFSMPSTAYLLPDTYGSLEGANGLVWIVSHLFFELKFMAMFSMMFGAGIVLMSRHRDAAGAPVLRVHFRRMVLLLFFGLVHAYLIWYGDILVPYAICGCFVVWARKWKPRTLVVAGVILIVIGSGFSVLIGWSSSAFPESKAGLEASFSIADQQDEIAAYQGRWIEHLPFRAYEAVNMQLFVLPLMFFWRIAGLMLLGMAIFKWEVLDAARSKQFYRRMVLVGALLGLPLVAYSTYVGFHHDFDPVHTVGYGSLPNYYGSVPVAFMWIGIVMLMCQSDLFAKIRYVLSCYGRLAFTNYIGQSILATFIFYGYGLGWFGSVSRVEQIGVVLFIWAIQLTFSPIWLRYFKFGPLEWVWRSGVYAKFQPMLRRTATES